MAAIVVNQGLQTIGERASFVTPTFGRIQTISVDDQSSAFLATDQDLDRAGGLTVTNMFDQAISPDPTRSSQTISHITTIPTGSGNFTIRRIALHNDTAANVSTSSNTLVAGVDGQSLTKTSDFTITFTLKLTYTSV